MGSAKSLKQRYTRVSVGGLALRGVKGNIGWQCICEIRLAGSKLPAQRVKLEVLPPTAPDPDNQITSATFYLSPEDLCDTSVSDLLSFKRRILEISILLPQNSWLCGQWSTKSLGTLKIPVTKEWSQGNYIYQPASGWKPLGSKAMEVHLYVMVEEDPRVLFEFEKPVLLGPQVVHVAGSLRQPVFTCKFRSETSGHRRNLSGQSVWSMPSVPPPSPQRERKGWMVTVHDLSGSPVAAASMVVPFVSSLSSGKVMEDNPGSWLILRPEYLDGPMQPWARLEAWRESSGSGVACRFDLLGDEAVAADGTTGAVISQEKLSVRHGGQFSLHTVVARISPRPRTSVDFGDNGAGGLPSPSSAASANKRGCRGRSSESLDLQDKYRATQKVQPVLSSKSSLELGELDGLGIDEGFLMKLMLRRGSYPVGSSLQIGSCHVTELNNAAVFVALAAAVELSVEACQSPGKMLKQLLKDGDGGIYV